MHCVYVSFLCLSLLFGCVKSQKEVSSLEKADPGANYKCSPAKEYITVLNYLKTNKNLNLSQKEQESLANEITQSCSGGAKRFIRVLELLRRSNMNVGDSINLAKEYALSDDNKTEAFLMIFSLLYLSEYLDLDLSSALQIARDFSVNFTGDHKIAKTNFNKIVNFCLSSKHLSLDHARCADLAIKITQCGQNFKQEIASSFIDSFYFLTSSKADAPNLTTYDAIGISQELVCTSPWAVDNFKTAYKFAISKKGHNLSRSDALIFALNLAKKTSKH